jgi:two-component system sensor histidine kinase KdpD
MGSGAHAEGDLAAAMARDLLGGEDLAQCLLQTAQRVAAALALPWAAVVLAPSEGDEGAIAVALRDRGQQVGTLLLPCEVPELTLRRARDRVAPALETLLVAALERRRLRRSDAVNTAILRSFSHDLRSQLTALMAAAQGLDSGPLSDADRRELAAVVDGGAARIAGLLDQQRLDAGAADPSRAWCALDEVLEAALGDFGLPAATFSVAVGDDVPPVHADPAQLRTSFGNLLANAARYSHGQPVRVDARRAGDGVTVRIADRGPGVPPDARSRLFEAANDGRIAIESTAGGGATFVVQLPLAAPVVEPATLRAAG